MKVIPVLLACVVAGVLLLYPIGAGPPGGAVGPTSSATPCASPAATVVISATRPASSTITPIPPPLTITATSAPPPATPTLTITLALPSPPVTPTPVATPTLLLPPPPDDIHIQANPLDVVINEVAWGGTAADLNDEWIELKSNLPITTDLSGWRLRSGDGTPDFLLGGVIAPGGYYLLERGDDSTVSDLPADQIYLGDLANGGETLTLLDQWGTVVDTANLDGGPWPGGSGFPTYNSMERIASAAADSDANWGSNDGLTRNGLDALGNPLNGTPRQPNSLAVPPPPPGSLYIGEVLYDATTPSTGGDEFAEICNSHTAAVDLTNHKVGDAQVAGGGEGMYLLPPGTTLAAGACLVVAKNAAQFAARFGSPPDFELVTGGSSYTDTPGVPDLAKYTAWSGGSWALANDGDEILLLDPTDGVLDAAAYGAGDFAALGLGGRASAPQPESLQRVWPADSDDMSADFLRANPNPGVPTYPPPPPGLPPPAIPLPGGMYAFFGDLHSYTTYSDGAGPPRYAFAVGRANGLHFLALTDHTAWLNGSYWADLAAQASSATVDGAFVGLRGFEWASPGTGYMGVFETATYVSPNDPAYDTPAELYAWLSAQAGAIGDFHRPAADSDFDDLAYTPTAVALLEIGSGVARFENAFICALARGWRVAPVNNSATTTVNWGADTPHRTGIVAPALTQAALLDALRARRAFATEDSNLALALRGNGVAWMGEVISNTAWLTLTVSFHDDDGEPLTMTLYDQTLPIAQTSTGGISGTWQVSAPGMAGHYYFVKSVQGDGDLAYSAPLWIEGTPTPDVVCINELLANPHAVDWDHNGVADASDEWIELYNPSPRPVGLGGYLLDDAEGGSDPYEIPLGTVIGGGGFLLFYRNTTGLALNASHESARLFRPDGSIADSFTFDSSPGYDRSWCRSEDGAGYWSKECIETPGGPNKLLPPPPLPEEPRKVSIARARRLPQDKETIVVGWVTAPPPLFGKDVFYIQDETAGIKVRVNNEPLPVLAEGDKVRVEGYTWDYHGERELRTHSGDYVQFREPGCPPDPLPIETAGVNEENEGILAAMTGRAVGLARLSFFLDDGSGTARVLLLGGTGIARPGLEGEELVTVVGIVSQDSPNRPHLGGYRFLPRYPRDLRLPLASPELLSWPSLLPETGDK